MEDNDYGLTLETGGDGTHSSIGSDGIELSLDKLEEKIENLAENILNYTGENKQVSKSCTTEEEDKEFALSPDSRLFDRSRRHPYDLLDGDMFSNHSSINLSADTGKEYKDSEDKDEDFSPQVNSYGSESVPSTVNYYEEVEGDFKPLLPSITTSNIGNVSQSGIPAKSKAQRYLHLYLNQKLNLQINMQVKKYCTWRYRHIY